MSRPIEFRAWNKKTRRMVDCKKTTPLAVHPDLLMAGLDGVFIPFHEDLIIEQYTGLKDKKRTEEFPEGQKIFEGDKLKVRNSTMAYQKMEIIGTVESRWFSWQVVDIKVIEWEGYRVTKPNKSYSIGFGSMVADKIYEVIGHIHSGE